MPSQTYTKVRNEARYSVQILGQNLWNEKEEKSLTQ
jgi:hypothetical protein